MASADPDERSRALLLVRAADWIEPLEREVYRLADDPDPAVRSSAIAALGRLRTPIAQRILRRALQDPDARVQANALEAVDQRVDQRVDQLEMEGYEALLADKLESPSSRVRAGAIRALLERGHPRTRFWTCSTGSRTAGG
jgi:HEAT repeat protein